MGYLGFLFNIDINSSLIKVLLDKEIKNDIIVFIEVQKLQGNYIVGVSNFKEENCDFFYLDKDFNLHNFLVFSGSKFKFGKIAVNDKTVVDFEFLTLWFNGESYRLIRETLFVDEIVLNLEEEIQNRVKYLINFFI